MSTPTPALPFDLAAAMAHLAAKDEKLSTLIAETVQFEIDMTDAQSPYEALMESIAYQSISGKAAATIFGRVKALGTNGRPPNPKQMLKLRKQTLRKAGLSGAKVSAMKDLALKTIQGIVPTREDACKMSDQELVERLVSVRGIGCLLYTSRERERRQRKSQNHGRRLRPDHAEMPVIAVPDVPAHRGQRQNRNLIGKSKYAQQGRRIRQLVHQPQLRRRLHPRSNQRDELPRDEQLKISMAQCAKARGHAEMSLQSWSAVNKNQVR